MYSSYPTIKMFRCGCPVIVEGQQNWGSGSPNECSPNACKRGCDFAFENQFNEMYNGEDVSYDLRIGLNSTELLTAMENLSGHISGTTPMDATQIDAARESIVNNGPLLPTELNLITSALDLIDEFETSPYGPLFINSRSSSGFPREEPASSDDKQLERAMLSTQQTVLDEIFAGTRANYLTETRLYDPIISECSSVLEGRSWQTAKYFPGEIQGPADSVAVEHTVSINTTYPACWGRPVLFCKEPAIKPTGLWLQAGKIATITVPPEIVTAGGYKIQIGSHTSDNIIKNLHLRNDRITSLYDINSEVVTVASPLGGGVYMRIPYLSDLDVITISVTGGVVKAPYFQHNTMHTTTEQEWLDRRTSPGPWADIVTDNFLLNVPRSGIFGYEYSHMFDLASNYTMSMDGVTEFMVSSVSLGILICICPWRDSNSLHFNCISLL